VNPNEASSGSDNRSRRRMPRPSPRVTRVVVMVEAIFGIFLLVAVLGVVAVMKHPGVHKYAITTVEKQLSETLGTGVHLQNFVLHPSALSVDLYGITIDGAAPYPTPPLLQLEHAEASVRIVSIFSRKWYLSNVTLNHPVAQIFVDKDGVSNLPKIKSSGEGSSSTTIFDLGIRHAVLDHGVIFYNDRPATLSADVRDLDLDASFNDLVQSYSGKMAYTDGHLEYGTWRPLTHALSVHFDASSKMLDFTRIKLICGASTLSGSAILSNYDNPIVEAQYDAAIDGNQLAGILRNAGIPSGIVRTTGSLHYAQGSASSVLQALAMEGSLTSRELNVKTGGTRTRITAITGAYALNKGDFTLRGLRASLLGGGVTARGVMKNLGGDSSTSLTADVRNLSLAEIRRVLGSDAMRDVALTGTLSATASAAWGKTIDDLSAKADATIDGHVANATTGNGAINSSALLLDSIVHAAYSNRNQELTLTNSYIRTPQTDVTMNGTVSKNSSLAVHLQANDLREVATVLAVFQPSAHPIDLAGQASFVGNVRGAISAPHVTGQLAGENLHFHGTDWKTLKTGVDLSPSHAELQHADLESAGKGRISLNATAGLTEWSFSKTSPVSVDLDVAQMSVAEALKLAGQPEVPVAGTLNANVKLHGSELEPVGNGTISLTEATVYEQPVQSAKVTLTGSGDDLSSRFTVELPAGRIEGTASVRPREKSYTAQLTAADIELGKLQVVQASNIDVTGAAMIHASGQGTFDNPGGSATLAIPTITFPDQKVTNLNLKVDVANRVANATLAASAINTGIQAKAAVGLSGDYPIDASLDTQGIPLEPLLAVYAPEEAEGITGRSEVHATLHGPLKNRKLLEGHIAIPVLKLDYNNTVNLAADAPIHIDYKDEVIRIQPAAIRGTDTDLHFEGSIPTTQNGPMALKLLGTVNLQIAHLFNQDLRTGGELKFNIDSHGAAGDPHIGGEIDIVEASFSSPDIPVGLQHGNGVLKLTRDRIDIASFQGTAGGGTVTAQGGLSLRPRLRFDVALSGHNLRVLYPEGMRETADADIRFSGTMQRASLGGTVSITDLSFTPAFDLDSFISQFSGGVAAPPSRGFAQNVSLNIAAHSTNNVSLVSRTLSVGGSASLQLRGTLADPVLLGRVNLTGGDIILGGKRFILSGGTIQFVNPSETQPVLNLALTTTVQQYDIHLRFNGPTDQLKTQYTSDPALPPADIINLLAFGETQEAAAQNPTTANQAAQSMLASQVSNQVTSRVSKIAGISQLSINPVLANSSSQGSPGANITIQQRVTGNLFVTFSTNVGSQQSETIQGQYQLTPRVAISVTSDPNGGFAFDTLIKKSW
jgi:translocation and assembly module TamB